MGYNGESRRKDEQRAALVECLVVYLGVMLTPNYVAQRRACSVEIPCCALTYKQARVSVLLDCLATGRM